MDFRTLTYFRVVAQELNFTHAAEKLNMSQPPLSNQIKNLEDDLGVQLFIRGKRKMKLTEAGHLLYRRSGQLLGLADKTRKEISAMEQGLSGALCIGLVEGRAPFITARYITGFRALYPMVTFRLTHGGGDETLSLLSRGLVDLAFIASPYDSEHLDSIPVGREVWTAHIPASHPLAADADSPLPVSDLSGEPLIVPDRKSRIDAIHRWFRASGHEPNIIVETASYLDALALAEQGAGIAIYPQTVSWTSPNVVQRLITSPTKIAEYVLVSEKNQPLTLLASEFRSFVSDVQEGRLDLPGQNPGPEEAQERRISFRIPADAGIL